jgi:hypothetical protein
MGLAVAGLLVTASPCRACSCAPSTPQGAFRKADAAFVGRVVQDAMVAKGTTQTFEVDEVYKGALASRIDVWAEVGTEWVSSCAILYPAGEPVALLLFEDAQGRWQASACSQVTRAELRRIGGAPREPIPAPDPEVTAPVVGPGIGDAGGGLPTWAVVLIGAGLAVGLVGGHIVWTARRDRRAAFPSGWDPVDTEAHGTR